MASSDIKQIRKHVDLLMYKTGADAKVPDRVSAVNNLLNGGYRLDVLDNDTKELEKLWDGLFFAIWHSEVGRGFEEITASIIRGCLSFPALIHVGFKTISKKWYGLDQFRVDKVSHLSRHLLNALIENQITICAKAFNNSKRTGGNLKCKPIIRNVLCDISNSKGLVDFILEIFGEETSKALSKVYLNQDLVVGNETLKAKIIIFIYKQTIAYARSQTKLESRTVRIFDVYVFKNLFDYILQHETQICQIVVTLRLKQTLDKIRLNNTDEMASCRRLMTRWSSIVSGIHENCINGKYFPHKRLPIVQHIDTSMF